MSILTEQQIENLLRAAPRPKAPANLKEQLMGLAPSASVHSRKFAANYDFAGWLRRWWPALAPATVSLACAVVLTVQQMEIGDLKAGVEALSKTAAAMEAASPRTIQSSDATPSGSAPAEAQEIARLKKEVEKLSAEISQLEQVKAENEKLHAQLAAPAANVLTPEETEAMEKAKERAMRIACFNNLRQLALCLKMWASDNDDTYPPDILSMTNEIGDLNQKILVCPADTARQAATDWSSFTSANCSYEFLALSEKEGEPNRVTIRCPIHGNVLLCDASVQADVAKTHPEWFVQRDGKLYFERPTVLTTPDNVKTNLNP